MARKVLIQIRRGLESAIGTLAVGELGYCTDTSKLYIGTAGGNVLLVAAQGTGDMLKSIYDTNNDGKVDYASAADSVSWSGVSGKPATYPPAAHNHDANYASAFTIGHNVGSVAFVKIAEMTTTISSSANELLLWIHGVSDFGTNKPGCDVIQMSTRGSGSVEAYGIIPGGGDAATYGYVVNATSGLTELWVRRNAYHQAMRIIIGAAEKSAGVINTGSLLTQAAQPAGFTAINKQRHLIGPVTWNQLKGV